MAIARDNSAGNTTAGPTSTVTISSFAVAASNPCLVVFVELNSGNDNLASVTFGGNAMTLITKAETPTSGEWVYAYYILGQSGTHDIVATQNTDTNAMRMVAISYTGVNQAISYPTTDSSTSNTANGGTTISCTQSPTTSNSWFVTSIWDSDTENVSASTNVTQVVTAGAGQTYFRAGDSNGVVSGSTTQTWTSSTSDHLNMIQVSISPPSTTTTKTEIGVARIQKSVTQTITGKARVTASTVRTETGVASIEKAATQTVDGLARVALVTTKTETGLSRVTAATPRTVTGTARVTATATRTETGVAKIVYATAATSPGTAANRTVTGDAWANVNNAKVSDNAYATVTTDASATDDLVVTNFGFAIPTGSTILGIKLEMEASSSPSGGPLVRIAKNGDSTGSNATVGHAQTISSEQYYTYGSDTDLWGQTWSASDINNSGFGAFTRFGSGNSGKAYSVDHFRMTVYYVPPTVQAITGTARITATTTRTETGRARITATTTKTESGRSRITVATPRTVTGKARVTATTTRTETGVSRVQVSTTRTETGVANIASASATQTINGTARIQLVTSQNSTGVARVTATTTRTEAGVARVDKSVSRTEAGVARVERSTSQTESGTARVTATTQRTESGVARVQITSTGTMAGTSRIETAVLRTLTGLSRITVSVARALTGASRVQRTESATLTGHSRIQFIMAAALTGTARVQQIVQQNMSAVARITVSVARTVTGKARITATTPRTETGVARIEVTTTRTIGGAATIYRPPRSGKPAATLMTKGRRSVLTSKRAINTTTLQSKAKEPAVLK